MGLNIIGGIKESPLDQNIPLGGAASGATRLLGAGSQQPEKRKQI